MKGLFDDFVEHDDISGDNMRQNGSMYDPVSAFYNSFNRGMNVRGGQQQGGSAFGKIVVAVAGVYLAKRYYESFKQTANEQAKMAYAEKRNALLHDEAAAAPSMFGEGAGYKAIDIADRINGVYPLSSLTCFKNLTPGMQRQYTRFSSARADHEMNVKAVFAQNGCNIEDCSFFDSRGRQFYPYDAVKSAPADLSPEKQCALVGSKKLVMDKSLMYALDHGAVQCVMPNGHVYSPSQDVKDGYVLKWQDQEDWFSTVDAQVEKERADRIKNITDFDFVRLMPQNLSQAQQRAFHAESMINEEAQSQMYDTISNNGLMQTMESVLKNAGAQSLIYKKQMPEQIRHRRTMQDDLRDMMSGAKKAASKVRDTAKSAASKVKGAGSDIIDKVMRKAEDMTGSSASPEYGDDSPGKSWQKEYSR